MRIEEIHVDGYGLLHGRSLEPDAGLTVVRGMNEAGKTTLLSFVRAILFGFETKRYRALAGGRRGGWLNVRTRDERAFRIERYGETGGQGRLRVLDPDGKDLGAGELPILLQGVGQQLFRNIFAFGLEELAQFERLTDEEVRARIYGAGLGLGAVSALEVENALGSEREGLFKPGGHNPAINALLRELEAVDERLRGLDLPAVYAQTVTDLADHDASLADLAARLGRANADRRSCERLADAWQPWLDLSDLRARREELGAVATLPADLPARLATVEARCEAADARLDELSARLAAQEAALEQVSVDTTVIDQRQAIEDLARAAERDRAREAQIKGVDDQVRLATRERDDALLHLGSEWGAERVEAFDDSVAVQSEISGRFRERLDRAADRLASARSVRDQVSRELDSAQTELEIVTAVITTISEALGDEPEVGDQERRLAAISAALSERDQAAERAASAATRAEAAAAALERTAEEVTDVVRTGRSMREALVAERQAAALLASLPAEVPAAVARADLRLPVVIGLAAVAAAVLVVALGAPPIAAVVVLAVGLLAAVAIWRLAPAPAQAPGGGALRESLAQQVAASRRTASDDAAHLGLAGDAGLEAVDALLARCAENEREIADASSMERESAGARIAAEQAVERLGAVAEAAGLSTSPTAAQITGLRERLEAARDRRSRRIGLAEQASTLQRRIEGLEHSAEDAFQIRTAAEADNAAALQEWAHWLGEHGLDVGFDRETARTVIDAVTAAKRPLRALADLDERRAGLLADHEHFLDQLSSTAAAIGWDRARPADRSMVDRLVADLEAALATALEAQRTSRNAREVLEALVRDEAKARETAATDATALADLLVAHGAIDVAGLRAAISASDAARAVDDRSAECQRTLTALSGPGAALDGLIAALDGIADVAEITARLDGVAARIGEDEETQGRLREEAGALRESIIAMERNVEATEDRQRREDLLARLQSQAESWSVLAIARHVLKQSRQAYEAAHRPAVIEAAEHYFEEWTAGRYRRILAPLGSQVEEVEHRDGTRVAIANLSTGTAQQLYLAIRFGLVEHFAENAEPLPIVMDDILVNFDDERAALAARSIERLAERHQVIYFTCHPETPLRTGKQLHLERLDTVAAAVAAG